MLQEFDERNRDLIVNIDGRLVHRDQARISPFDSVVQGGDAVWEGLRLYDGRIFRLIEHLDRLRDSARALAFADIPSHEHVIEQIRRTLEANGMRDGVHIRLTLTRGEKITSGMDPRLNRFGSTLIVLPEWKAPVYDRGGIRLITSSIRRFPPDMLDPKIHHANLLQSILAKIQANVAGVDDALMLGPDGFVAETNATHLFAVEPDPAAHDAAAKVAGSGGTPGAGAIGLRVVTGSTRFCPEGITRGTVLDLCRRDGIPWRVRDLSLTEVYRARELFCTGTMGELAPVVEVDGRRIGDGQTGRMTRRLSELYAAEVRAAGYSVVD